MFAEIKSTFLQFTDLSGLFALAQPSNAGLVISLVLLELVLSADNAVVLAMTAKHLPEHLFKRAMWWGFLGSYVTRVLAIGFGVVLVKLWFIKAAGALYLLFISLKFFYKKFRGLQDHHNSSGSGGFWIVVAQMIWVDMIFSIDSVLAAIAVSDNVWVLLVGGVLGILAMRVVATQIVGWMKAVPELEPAAFLIIFFIAVKMGADLLGLFHLGHNAFFIVITVVFGGAFALNRYRRSRGYKY